MWELSFVEQGARREDFLADMRLITEQIFCSWGEMRLEIEAFYGRVFVNPAVSNALPRPLDDAEWDSYLE